jgi:hypothetical protein
MRYNRRIVGEYGGEYSLNNSNIITLQTVPSAADGQVLTEEAIDALIALVEWKI